MCVCGGWGVCVWGGGVGVCVGGVCLWVCVCGGCGCVCVCFPFVLKKGCGMGPWLVLVSSCCLENVVATCKIGSFLFSLDNLLQKNVIVLFFGNQISKWPSFEKRAIFNLLFTFSSVTINLTKAEITYNSSGSDLINDYEIHCY